MPCTHRTRLSKQPVSAGFDLLGMMPRTQLALEMCSTFQHDPPALATTVTAAGPFSMDATQCSASVSTPEHYHTLVCDELHCLGAAYLCAHARSTQHSLQAAIAARALQRPRTLAATQEHRKCLSVCVQAFADPDALGVIAVRDVPELTAQRAKLLPLAARLASLPAPVLQKYEHPQVKYSLGWSCGQERLQNGQPDRLKGSFYANPLHRVQPSLHAGTRCAWGAADVGL